MARTVAELPKGTRITDFISLGVLTKTFPLDRVIAVIAAAGKTSRRQRDLPSHVVLYYVIALTLYMQVSYREVLRCLLEGIKWLLGPEWEVKVTGKSGISQARTRLGWEPLKQLHDEVVSPIAVKRTKGAWYRAWRLVSVDGSTVTAEPVRPRPGIERHPPLGMSLFAVKWPALIEIKPPLSKKSPPLSGNFEFRAEGPTLPGIQHNPEGVRAPLLLVQDPVPYQ